MKLNVDLSTLSAQERITWSFEHLPENHVLSSSFGVQAAVTLHLTTQVHPDVDIIFIDTGYHFPETYQFVDELTDALKLNLHVFKNPVSPAWQEARHGQRWLDGLPGIEKYNQDNKLTPMQEALREIRARTWITGIRRTQSNSRKDTAFLSEQRGVYKLSPIADWSDRDVHEYLVKYNLPYHPLREKGYVSIGDVHSTKSLSEVDHIDETRFFGLKRECGLHD